MQFGQIHLWGGGGEGSGGIENGGEMRNENTRRTTAPCAGWPGPDTVRYLGQKELPRQLHLRCAEREVAEEAAFLLNQERLGQRLGLGSQDLDPLLQLAD